MYPEEAKNFPSSEHFTTLKAGRFVPAVGDGEAAEDRLGLELLAGTPPVCAPAECFFAPYATPAWDFVTPDVDPRRGAGFLQEKHPGRRGGREGTVQTVLWAGGCG